MKRCIKLDVRIDIEHDNIGASCKVIIFQDYGKLTKLQVLELQNLINNYIISNDYDWNK